ncbi:MAG: CDP-alcohol phosphatidyltransferase family protein [Candidatus Odinarchaeum yellowstonii]|uniref:CDP-alcohol phosphatidyltransferase family protein n=1 Tax=Odinarchaeota yellowstonii (strain LCB_4) TaxID=1841599 RepID=A0AAF0D2S7_ODILC|nr:MAG: CDP-alcohol phosphatidyltransferase family protein [Candidatus Odinarchaeum yellowstonii]
MLGKLREKYQKMMSPVGVFFSKLGLTPNIITFISFLVSICAGVVLALNMLVLGVIFIILTGFVDMLDGAVARATGKSTRFGAVWDHLLDRYAEFNIVFGLAFSLYSLWYIPFITIFSMIMASFVRAKAESVGKLEKCTVGLAERQEKLLILIVGCLLTYFYSAPVVLSFTILDLALLLITVLSQITVIQRLKYTWDMTKGG